MREGRQTPTTSVVLPYKESMGPAAIYLYEDSQRTAIDWQKRLITDILGMDENEKWVHQKFGYSVPRRNGKNEVIAMRELYSLVNGEKVCHTAHRVSTSHSAWERLVKILGDAGYTELGRRSKKEKPPKYSFRTTKARGLETIELTGGGVATFRTRTTNGGLGEGFDLLVIDEAQEYTVAQQSALVYTVSDSKNPQTIYCGTPPTTESAGTVFAEMRKSCVAGETVDTGWAEWAVDREPRDLLDVDLWYETNPSMGHHLDERKIRSEYDPSNPLDFTIQRLGFWYMYSLKSAILESEWRQSEVAKRPDLKPERYFAVKFAKDKVQNVCLSVASKTMDGKVFLEAIDCRPVRSGVEWLIPFFQNPNYRGVIYDGESGGEMLADLLKENKVRKGVKASLGNVIDANAKFENAVFNDGLRHIDQEPLRLAISNCQHRPIGSKGGFGYQVLEEQYEVGLIESAALAYWLCTEAKETKKQTVSL